MQEEAERKGWEDTVSHIRGSSDPQSFSRRFHSNYQEWEWSHGEEQKTVNADHKERLEGYDFTLRGWGIFQKEAGLRKDWWLVEVSGGWRKPQVVKEPTSPVTPVPWHGWSVICIFFGSKITAGDCSHEIKRHLLLGRKAMTNLDSILKNRDITLPTKVHLVKPVVFPIVMYGCESWTIKKAECRTIDALNCGFGEDSLESHGLQTRRSN